MVGPELRPGEWNREHKSVKAKTIPFVLLVGISLVHGNHASAALASGVFQTSPDATVEERGDYVPNGSRVVPFSVSLTLDLAAVQPSLTAVIHNAVLEGGSAFGDVVLGGRPQPFELTVHSLSGAQLADGSYRFTGDYLRDIYPSGTQYLFDWQFSSASDGSAVWNGHSYWAGGHIWIETISDVALVPEPGTAALIWAAAMILWAFRASQRSHNPQRGANL